MRTQERLNIDYNIKESDILLLGLGDIERHSLSTGFTNLVDYLGMSNFFKKFDIFGELAYIPFNNNGSLFHYLLKKVFKTKKK